MSPEPKCPLCGAPKHPSSHWYECGSSFSDYGSGPIGEPVPEGRDCLRRQLAAKDAKIELLQSEVAGCRAKQDELETIICSVGVCTADIYCDEGEDYRESGEADERAAGMIECARLVDVIVGAKVGELINEYNESAEAMWKPITFAWMEEAAYTEDALRGCRAIIDKLLHTRDGAVIEIGTWVCWFDRKGGLHSGKVRCIKQWWSGGKIKVGMDKRSWTLKPADVFSTREAAGAAKVGSA